jgi:transcriptional regulator with AAA-type ATPase domain
MRSLWLAMGAASYVAFAALEGRDSHGLEWLLAACLPIALALVWRATMPARVGPVERGAWTATRACATGACILIGARLGPASAGLTALGNLGAALASMSGLFALARIAPIGGLLTPPPQARRVDAAAFSALFWTVAVALPAAKALWPARAGTLSPLVVEYATLTASLGSLGLGVAATARLHALRRLELGVGDRSLAALSLTATVLLSGLSAGAAGLMPLDRVMPAAVVVAALLQCWAAIWPEPTEVARALRVTIASLALAGPWVLGAVYAASAWPGKAAPYVFVAGLAAMLAGLAARRLALRLSPEKARFQKALDAATHAAMSGDPDVALPSALSALHELLGATDSGPTLYRLSPAEAVTVDRAGYVQAHEARLPSGLVELASEEPDRVLRTEAVRSVEVRRPEVRPLLQWFDQHSVGALAVVRSGTEAIAVLTMPRRRQASLRLEETRALGRLADRLGAVVEASSMLARSRQRELMARADAESARVELARVTERLSGLARRLTSFAHELARPARVASYSPAARIALEQLERLGASGRPLTLLSAPGVDQGAWAAVAHLASPFRDGPIVVVDGTDASTHELTYWRDPSQSPAHAAHGGTLVVLDVHALPRAVQSYIAVSLTERLGLIVGVPSTVDALVAANKLDERLADTLGDRAIALPTLAMRSEDLRALALNELVKLGVGLRGAPLGLDLRAQARLAEHAWPGNDAELRSVLVRAALVARGDVIREADLDASGFNTKLLTHASRDRTPRALASHG